ncbi:hypothetical protein B0J14DRAFT_608992 [Halenospora varia]|nr:hypothetical protein B0J14DRAFT_608992 [Halenospora varia]
MKMSGYGGTEQPFAQLDEGMLEVIAFREDRQFDSSKDSSVSKVSHRWTHGNADVGVFKTGQPNKQQMGSARETKGSSDQRTQCCCTSAERASFGLDRKWY